MWNFPLRVGSKPRGYYTKKKWFFQISRDPNPKTENICLEVTIFLKAYRPMSFDRTTNLKRLLNSLTNDLLQALRPYSPTTTGSIKSKERDSQLVRVVLTVVVRCLWEKSGFR
ncbi:hypothetical protein ACFE04_024388 [Oxalis oulophora]